MRFCCTISKHLGKSYKELPLIAINRIFWDRYCAGGCEGASLPDVRKSGMNKLILVLDEVGKDMRVSYRRVRREPVELIVLKDEKSLQVEGEVELWRSFHKEQHREFLVRGIKIEWREVELVGFVISPTSESVALDVEEAFESIAKLEELDANENVFTGRVYGYCARLVAD